MPPKSQDPNPWRYLGLGVELAAATAVLTWLGFLFDSRFGTGPFGAVIGAMIGAVGGMYNLIKQAMKESR